MWKYIVAMLMALLALGGVVSAQDDVCADCYANVISQYDVQQIDTIRLALEVPYNPVSTVAVGNEGLTAGIIVTKDTAGADGDLFVAAPFATINQGMNQRVSNLGNIDVNIGDGAKSVTWNKAIQAAWVANQGVKELERNSDGVPVYVKEGAYVLQSTTQVIDNVFDYDSREKSKVLNVDNKLAMIVDDMEAIIDLTAKADSKSTDSMSSKGTIENDVNITIKSLDP